MTRRRKRFVFEDPRPARERERWVGVEWTGPSTVRHVRGRTEDDVRREIGLRRRPSTGASR